MQIPDKALEHRSRGTVVVAQNGESTSPQSRPTDDDEESDNNFIIHDAPTHNGQQQNGKPLADPRRRRLSTYEDGNVAVIVDPESGKTRSSS